MNCSPWGLFLGVWYEVVVGFFVYVCMYTYISCGRCGTMLFSRTVLCCTWTVVLEVPLAMVPMYLYVREFLRT